MKLSTTIIFDQLYNFWQSDFWRSDQPPVCACRNAATSIEWHSSQVWGSFQQCKHIPVSRQTNLKLTFLRINQNFSFQNCYTIEIKRKRGWELKLMKTNINNNEQWKMIKWERRIATELPTPPTPTVRVRHWSLPHRSGGILYMKKYTIKKFDIFS